ncbi:plasmid mobilization protein [Oceanicola sp. S124]|uniref:plasmid mobilization protein n=1 Tax=Oceanicola sp. S124 TaxID=1042378 RepID=UPI00143B34C2|nr:plasmid mobilization relaxosome protein MobC [Oceanicola sp. S124]
MVTSNIKQSAQRARRPGSRSSTVEPGPCEGRQASPSNPNWTARGAVSSEKQEAVFFYCSSEEKALIRQAAADRGLSMSAMLRQLATGAAPKRRKPAPRVDPALVLAVSRYGGNLNQIARWLNTATRAGRASEVEALRVAAALVGIERRLVEVIAQHRRPPGC